MPRFATFFFDAFLTDVFFFEGAFFVRRVASFAVFFLAFFLVFFLAFLGAGCLPAFFTGFFFAGFGFLAVVFFAGFWSVGLPGCSGFLGLAGAGAAPPAAAALANQVVFGCSKNMMRRLFFSVPGLK